MIDHLIKLQKDLIDALDRGDVDDVEAITREIEQLISERSLDVQNQNSDVSFAVKLNIAAAMRLNALNNWNNQKLSRIQSLRQRTVTGLSTGFN